MPMSHAQRRRHRHAVAKNARHGLFRIPGEIRNQIYGLVLDQGELLESKTEGENLPRSAGKPDLPPILCVSKQLRGEGLAYLYSNNRTRIQVDCDGAQSTPIYQRYLSGPEPSYKIVLPRLAQPTAYMSKLLTPSIVLKASRDLEILMQVKVTTEMSCYWHVIGIAVTVKNDEVSCRTWFECCEHDERCYEIIMEATQAVSDALLDAFDEKIKAGVCCCERKWALVTDKDEDSPRYEGVRSCGFVDGFTLFRVM